MIKFPKFEAKDGNVGFAAFSESVVSWTQKKGKKAPIYFSGKPEGGDLVMAMPSDFSSAYALQLSANGGLSEGIKFPALVNAAGKAASTNEDCLPNPHALWSRKDNGQLVVVN